MTNEVINETEESPKNESTVSDSTNTANSGATATIEPTASTDDSAIPAEQSTGGEQTSSGEEDFGSILEKFEQEQTIYHTGDLVEGKVVGISDRGVLIDFGYKSEGIVPIEEFTNFSGEVSVKQGDTVEVVIRSINTGDAPPVLSKTDAVGRVAWGEIERAFNEETPITGRVIDKTKGGLIVDVLGIEAFLPGSQIDSRPVFNLDSYKGQELEAKIIKFSRKRSNIVLSRKILTDEIVNKQKAETLGQIEEGYVIEGTIKNLTEYGAFVDIGGIDGLLHVTDMSWGRLQNPGDQFKVSDHIQVKVLKLDRQRDKISLGYKQLVPDPWSTVMEVYPINAKIKGVVSSVTDYGAFIELEPGVEGLVHVSEMSWSKRAQNPKRFLKPGDEVEVQVLGIDTGDRRISLGMKQLQSNPWETIRQRYQVGAKVHGRIRNLTDFGAFVEIEEGVDGLVHVSDITWSKKVKHPKDVLKKDQEVDAVITSIDTVGQRMSLSIKELTPSAWEAFVATHRTGDIVRGTVSRFAGFGVFVQLGEDLEGLCHISELSDERVNKPEDVVAIGQEMDFKILRIENDVQKIGLSARAVGKEEEPIVDTKMYSTEAKSGMASLGELMNLKRSSATEEEPVDEPKLSKKERKAQQARNKADDEANSDSSDDDSQAEATTGEPTDESSEISDTASTEEPAGITETSTEENDSTVTTQNDPAENSSSSEENNDSKVNTSPVADETAATGGQAADEQGSAALEISNESLTSGATENSPEAETSQLETTDPADSDSESGLTAESGAPSDSAPEQTETTPENNTENTGSEEKSAKG